MEKYVMTDVIGLLEKLLQDLISAESRGDNLRITMAAIRNLTIAAESFVGIAEEEPQSVFKFQRQPRRIEYLVLGEMDGDLARRLYKERRVRDETFSDPTLFGEPAWDILLDALVAEVHRKPIQITSACIAAAVPATTGLRWIEALIKKGYLSRAPDESDRRRAFLRMTKHGKEQMQRYFDRIAKLR